MDCELIQPDLVPFHFGVIEEADRLRIEAHLVACPRCLCDYLALKREIETTRESDARPSERARDRLREAVAREVRPEEARARVTRSRWERPLAWGLAAATVGAALFAVQTLASSPGAAPHAITRPADDAEP